MTRSAAEGLGLGGPIGVSLSDFTRQIREEAEDARRAREFRPDRSYERQEGVFEALAAVRSGVPVVFVSGRAGTGKSRLISYLKTMPGGERQVVVAPTGIAAMNLKASTIHGFFRIPPGVIDVRGLEDDLRPIHEFRKMRRLVIDEISMVRADILDAIDRRLRVARDIQAPFGGVQVIMIGDFLQLPPVVTEEDRALLERLGYDTPFAFSAHCLQSAPIRVATLKKVWRQSDPGMIEALGWIREGRNVAEALAWLNERCAGPHREGVAPLMLTARRDAADAYNEAGIAALREKFEGDPDARFVLHAMSSGAYEAERAMTPAPRVLELYPGARVMAVKNDPAGSYVNGSLGEVIDFRMADDDFEQSYVRVLFDGADIPVRVSPSSWTMTTQTWDEAADAIGERAIGEFDQIPLVPGYAVTIHKSQGLSLSEVRVDLGRGAFAPGQLYVALSRATSPEGLSLVRPVTPRDVQVDEMLVKFLQWARRAANLEFEPVRSRHDQEDSNPISDWDCETIP